jgi:hypothetical protein
MFGLNKINDRLKLIMKNQAQILKNQELIMEGLMYQFCENGNTMAFDKHYRVRLAERRGHTIGTMSNIERDIENK